MVCRVPSLPLRRAQALGLMLLGACSEQSLRPEQPQNGGTPAISVEPGAIDIGPLAGGETEDRVLRVRSVGDADLYVEAIELVDPVDGLRLEVGLLPTMLPPGGELQALVHFDAHVVLAEGSVVVRSDDAGSPELQVPVTASAQMAWLQLAPDPLDLGTVVPGASRSAAVALQNVGNVPLVVDQVLLLAEAVSLDALPELPLTIPPGGSVPLSVTFAPLDRIEEAAQLWVQSSSWMGDEMGTITGRGGWEGIAGRVCDPSGDGWVIDARVFADIDLDGDGLVDWTTEARSDAQGHFRLADVPPGTWTVQIEKGSYRATIEVTVPEGGLYELPEEVCLDPDSATLAVVSGEYDQVQTIVAQLGLDYDLYAGSSALQALLADEALLLSYDVLFLNCGDYRALEEDRDELGQALAAYVTAGGSVYASDWAALLVEASWPGLLEFHGEDRAFEGTAIGMAGELEVDVEDLVMAYAIGDQRAEVLYDLDAWVTPVGVSADATVLVRGTVPTFAGTYEDVPLAVRAEEGGRLIFTTFHNERQITEDMDAALREIILSL